MRENLKSFYFIRIENKILNNSITRMPTFIAAKLNKMNTNTTFESNTTLKNIIYKSQQNMGILTF